MRRNITLCLPQWERPANRYRQLEQQRNMALANVLSGATRVSKVLTANNQECTIFCAGQKQVGIGLTSMSAGQTVTFYGSTDGLSFNVITVGAFPAANPPASGVTTATANGNYEVPVQNYIAIRVQLTTGGGNVTVTMCASADSSYQEAFIAQSTVFVNSQVSSGRNTLTQAAQANRAWNLTFLEVSLVGPGFGGNAKLTIYDGAITGTVLFSDWVTGPSGSVGTVQKINLPVDAQGTIGIQGTPGNAMTIVLDNAGNVASSLNTRFSMS